MGKTTTELEDRGYPWKSNWLLESIRENIIEIRSLGNLTYPDLADLLFATNEFSMDQLRFRSRLSTDWIEHFHFPHNEDKSNVI